MSLQSDWAASLADSVVRKLSESRAGILLHSITVLPDDTVEFIYSDPMDHAFRGIKVDATSVHSRSERIRSKSTDELAIYLIHVGMEEPRPKEEFLPPDSKGVRWLPLHRWLDE